MTIQLFRGKGRHPYYLRLVADNGQVLVTSEGYYSRFNAKRAAAKNFPGISLRDLSKEGE